MSLSNVVNSNAFLRTTRVFPSESDKLSVELNRTYVDIANIVNVRTIGLFPVNRPAQNGESWFISMNQRQQGFRQVYTFTSLPATIPHGLSFTGISQFTRIYGTAFDGSIYYPLPYVDIIAATNQISITVDGTNINVTAGAGSPPAIQSGSIVLEWIADP